MERCLNILGAGGNAADIIDIVDAINVCGPTWKVTGFLDDTLEIGATRYGHAVIGKIADAARLSAEVFLINAIGSDISHSMRGRIVAGTGVSDDRFATLLHPATGVSPRARIGAGSYASFGTSVGRDAVVGRHVHLGAGCVIGHDAVIEDFALLAAGAIISGAARIGSAAYIGAGSSVKHRVNVGAGARIGMGAVVVRDVPAGATVVGNPAREVQPKAGRSVDGL
jgi:sugar O-acyltransferase (sialic acid O-acetyltransferase NeuD family)